jgi:Domain of unknown function (DUF5011)
MNMMKCTVVGAVVGTLVVLGGLPAAASSPLGLECSTNSNCDDGNGCTADVCTNGMCEHPLLACYNGHSCVEPEPTLTSEELASSLSCTPNPGGEPTFEGLGAQYMTLECGQDVWVDPGAVAWDGQCNPLTVHTYNSGHDGYGPGPNTCAEGTYPVQYIAWDAQGRTVGDIRYVTVDDRTPPRLTLKGAAHLTLQCGNGYVEPGWDAWDACYGNITAEVRTSGYPNGWVAGTYTVTYTLTDSGGNSAPTLTRTVDVVNCPW